MLIDLSYSLPGLSFKRKLCYNQGIDRYPKRYSIVHYPTIPYIQLSSNIAIVIHFPEQKTIAPDPKLKDSNLAPNDLHQMFRDRECASSRMPTDNLGVHTRVAHAQALHAIHPKLGVDDATLG